MIARQVLLYTASALGCALMPARAHDVYAPLVDKWGRSCCSESDCRPAPYRVTPSGIEMFVQDRWFSVPEEKIQYRFIEGDTGETKGGHWCGQMYLNGYITYCAFLPPKVTLAR